jgi:hypothetical protein
MFLKHTTTDSADVPNPAGPRLPEHSDAGRREGRAPPIWLTCATLIALMVGCGLGIWLFHPTIVLFQELIAEAVSRYRDTILVVVAVAGLVALTALLASLWNVFAGLTGALVLRFRQTRLQNDQPVDAELLRRPEWGRITEGALLEHYLTQRAWADKSGARALTTYAPAFHNRQDVQGAVEGERPLLPLPDVPTFGELAAAGKIGRGIPLLLGIDTTTGEAVQGSFKSLYSCGVGGLQGSGKTWTAASILAQSAMHGARLVVCDPHAGDEESLALRVAGLAPAFLCDIAEDDIQIMAALKLAAGELQARKDGAKQRWPLIVAVDEWTALRRGKLAQLLPILVEDFSTEGRKFNCHVALLGQRWDKNSVGDFRNTLASAYVHRLRLDEARMLTGLPAGVLPNDTMQLAPGESYFIDTRGALHRIATPRMTMEDIALVGQVLGAVQLGVGQGAIAASIAESASLPFGFRPSGSQTAVEANGKPTGSQREAKPQVASTASGSAPMDPEAARIVALFLQGKTMPEIVLEVYSLSSSAGGRRYTDALRKVETVLRNAMQGGA